MADSNIYKILTYARRQNCSDIHFTKDLPPVVRHNGEIQPIKSEEGADILGLIHALMTPEQIDYVENGYDLDFGFIDLEGYRYRVNVYHQDGSLAAAIRILNDNIPTIYQLRLPPVLATLAMEPRGLVLVTGPTGSGKSTTLAAMIDYINMNRKCHIITLEDPVEYKHNHKNSMINQREIGKDAKSFADALRSAMREDPDVILVGEMRDAETIQAALTAAETGHLVLSTLHTTGAARTIMRIIDAAPGSMNQVCTQLASTLKGVISQTLVKKADNSGRVAAMEILIVNEAVSNLIRENKTHQMNSVMQTGTNIGMQLLDNELMRLYKSDVITYDEAIAKAANKNDFTKTTLNNPRM